MTKEQALRLAQNMDHISLSIDGLPEVYNALFHLRRKPSGQDGEGKWHNIFHTEADLRYDKKALTAELSKQASQPEKIGKFQHWL